jgi:hypothetical protein
MLKTAVEKANKVAGGWPDDDAIISQLEGLMHPDRRVTYIRPDTHQGYKDAMTGFSINSPDYPFQILDPEPHHHDPDPQHHGASRLAQGGADLDVCPDRQDLAADEGLSRAVEEALSPLPGERAGCSGAILRRFRLRSRRSRAPAAAPARAGHELPFYPGYYPQEIRLRP